MHAEVRSDDSTYFFTVQTSDTKKEFPFARHTLQNILASIVTKDLSDGTGLYSDTSFEIIVYEESPFPAFRMREELIRVSDDESKITYEVSPASDEYMIWLIATASSVGSVRDLGFSFHLSRIRLDRLGTEENILDVLRVTSPRLITLKLTSANKLSLRRFQAATYSFLFHIAYNLNVALVPQRFFEEVSRRGRIGRMRRSRSDELDPPRRIYTEDLVNHYILAISTDSTTLQFLSHYHVLEHFFESVFNDDLIEQIKTAITQPGFSYKRKKDVSQLITTIKKSLQIRSETITFSEIAALRLSLTKFIDVESLLTNLQEYDPSLIEYYASTEVPFSRGATVSLGSGNNEQIIKDLAHRIYSTRNALVHSKDGDKARYIPFKDEHSLLMEIPLMRFISEMVILAVSEIA